MYKSDRNPRLRANTPQTQQGLQTSEVLCPALTCLTRFALPWYVYTLHLLCSLQHIASDNFAQLASMLGLWMLEGRVSTDLYLLHGAVHKEAI